MNRRTLLDGVALKNHHVLVRLISFRQNARKTRQNKPGTLKLIWDDGTTTTAATPTIRSLIRSAPLGLRCVNACNVLRSPPQSGRSAWFISAISRRCPSYRTPPLLMCLYTSPRGNTRSHSTIRQRLVSWSDARIGSSSQTLLV